MLAHPGPATLGAMEEVELKIPVPDLGPVRSALRAAGARPLHPAAREVNVLFDADDGRIASGGGALRLRRYAGRAVLTLKGPPHYSGGVKRREEHETAVEDPEAAERILERLGFRARVRYEKDRETWALGSVEVALDRTPMGAFVELEGPEAAILEAARSLGLDPTEAVRESYVALWEAYRRAHPGLRLPEDMVFGR